MEINVGTKTTEQSNEFLRCLWAEIAKEFGKCAWHYTPYKKGLMKKITFGYMDIGERDSLEVGVTYKDKGSINNIYFLLSHEDREISKGTELYLKLKKVVNSTKENIGQYSNIYFNTTIKSYYPLMS